MQRFLCACGNEVYFESSVCLGCSRALGFSPGLGAMMALEASEDSSLRSAGEVDFGERFRPCANRDTAATCNWLLGADEDQPFCRACRITRVIPSLVLEENASRWRTLEAAKRRLLRALLRLGLDFETPGPYATPPLAFAFKEDARSNPEVIEEYVTTGHLDGLVTINVAEADAAYREQLRGALRQPYRTVLGHLRHEAGHFYFDRLLRQSPVLDEFRGLFGDERTDYHGALEAFYAGTGTATTPAHVSDYAAAHPLEDWAECFAHVLHIEDTLETAGAHGFAAPPSGRATWLDRWREVSVMLNEMNRSMGHEDAYPFVITAGVATKLEFVRTLVRQAGRSIENEEAR